MQAGLALAAGVRRAGGYFAGFGTMVAAMAAILWRSSRLMASSVADAHLSGNKHDSSPLVIGRRPTIAHLTGQHGADPSKGNVYFWEPVANDDVSVYLAFLTERYPVLREALDRVTDELVKEGSNLQRLSACDRCALNDQLPDNTSGD